MHDPCRGLLAATSYIASHDGFNVKNQPVIEVMGEDSNATYLTGEKLGEARSPERL